MRQISRRRERAIALLRSQGSGGGGEVEREGGWWSVACALDDADERPPPSSLVVRCDTAEALALARAAAATKREQNARLAAAASVSGTRKWRTQDGEDKGKKAARSRPAGELWRRLSRGHGTTPTPAATSATACNLRSLSRLRPGWVLLTDVFCSYSMLYHTQCINVYSLETVSWRQAPA
jgi:hypothetical protein